MDPEARLTGNREAGFSGDGEERGVQVGRHDGVGGDAVSRHSAAPEWLPADARDDGRIDAEAIAHEREFFVDARLFHRSIPTHIAMRDSETLLISPGRAPRTGDTGNVTATAHPDAPHADDEHQSTRRRLADYLPRVSVRTRIVAAITVVSAVAMLAVGVAVYLVQRDVILRSIDDRLRANLQSARFIIEEGPTVIDATADPNDPTSATWESADHALYAIVGRMSPDDNTGALGIIDGKAAIVPGIALDLDLQAPPGFVTHVAEESGASPVIGTYAEDGVVWRYLTAPVSVDGVDRVVFALAYDVEAELAEINDAARAYMIGVAVALVVVAGVALVVATRLLRPLRQMRETAQRVSARSLTERLPVLGRDDVSDLAATMNDMLDRIDRAVDSQRQLLSDVGHELKTPITIVRGNLEVVDADDPTDVRETIVLATDELDRMGTLVQDLSRMAALHGPSPIAPKPVDADELVRQIARKMASIEGARVELGAVAHVVAELDPARITQAVLQLAQNGVTHGGGQLEVGSSARDRDLRIWVRDYGLGVPDADKTAVFGRFYRGENGGSGLGLNIVHVIARAHGGSVVVTDAPGGGALFILTLPGAVASAGTWPKDIVVPPRPPLPVTDATPGRV